MPGTAKHDSGRRNRRRLIHRSSLTASACIQFENIDGNDIDQFKDGARQVVVYPPDYRTGELVYPFDKAKTISK